MDLRIIAAIQHCLSSVVLLLRLADVSRCCFCFVFGGEGR